MPTGWDLSSDSPLLPFAQATGGRARFSVDTPPRADAPPVARLLAGAAEVDITPPPGLPKAGYSRNAHDGTGFRSRLRARVMHLRSGHGSLALVQCDLLGGSAVVHRLVARAVAERTDVPLAGLMMGATHTHAGPGQFLGTDFYNRFASNRAGFDPAWTQVLAERIAGAVERAVAERGPARLAVGRTDVWGLTRNRSLRPHVRNAGVAVRRAEPQRAYVGINPWLELVRVDAESPGGGTEPLAAMVVFSVHGTGVPMRAPDYNADLWAHVVGELGARIEAASGARPVVGAVEGTHADVAPALHPGRAGHLEAQRVGARIGAEAAALWERLEGDLRADVSLGAGLREVDIDADRRVGGVTLPRRPAVGAALVAGAFENETPVLRRIPPFRAGTPKPSWLRGRNPHGAKWVIGSRWLQPLTLPLDGFPRVIPVQVLRIGGMALVGLPFEVTVESGRRIAGAVEAATGRWVERAVVSSVANEYAGYCATADEYELQHYEGGHTLYGPATQSFFGAHAAALARAVAAADGRPVTETAAVRRFDLAARRRLPAATGVAVPRLVRGPARFTDATPDADPCWSVEWRDVSPGDLRWHEPLVRVEAADGERGSWQCATRHGRAVDDQGTDLEVTHAGADPQGSGHRYVARWWDPAFRAGRRHRFVLLGNGPSPEVCSAPFD
ncbi:MAG: neutral/alkaline non-lysosomal ceramidase N-terminal domain-containing protein [Actinobacteria bacterium]|nr:neutral/alkaline non-lysosomal ceramidase N-terminal domain-containing protein [Actinomycetota bacterium]